MKKALLLLAVLLTPMFADAQQVSEQEALQKAQQFFANRNKSQAARGMLPRKAPKLTLANDRNEYFVFNDEANGGYVVVSGEERMPDVLAYSYEGNYDVDSIPSNMQAWMEEYAGQVEYLRAHPAAKVTRRTAAKREDVEPLLTCSFSQRTPYNNKCPVVDGEHCPTGCVATAMAQIMYYYQWPKQTKDIIPSYTTDSLKIEMPAQPVTTIDWDNILEQYYSNENYTEAQTDAIATLMLLCGTSTYMEYLPNLSASPTTYAVWALRRYFGYEDLLEEVNRSSFGGDEWEQMIYEELSAGRPIFYSGMTEDYGGHAFVLDGYKNGSFHVNWGWGGYNSYVTMTDVDGWEGYTCNHSAIFGIRPDRPNETNTSRYAVLDNGKMTIYYDKEMKNRPGTVLKRLEWYSHAQEVTECVIDPSFANLKQKDLSQFFYGFRNMKSIEGMENLNTTMCSNMSEMFMGCSSLTSVDLSKFKTGHVTKMSAMFAGCKSLTNLDVSSFNTDNVTDMNNMFFNCSSLTTLDVSRFKTDKVTDMSWMFYFCLNLQSLDVSGFNTSNVLNMLEMFGDCLSLTSLDVSGFKTDRAVMMASMFGGCRNLKMLDVSGFKTDNVANMVQMFYGCSSLTSLDLSGFNTANVTDMSLMFRNCKGLTSLDVSSFKTNNVTDMGSMFEDCSGLTSLDLSNFKTVNVTNMSRMFEDCSNLKTIYAGEGWNTDKVESSDYMFRGCYYLVGGKGTEYNPLRTDQSYARIDGGLEKPGYFSVPGQTDPPQSYAVLSGDGKTVTFYYDTQKSNRGGIEINKSYLSSNSNSPYGSATTVVIDASFADNSPATTAYWFQNCSSLTNIKGIENLKTDYVTDMQRMFYGCSSLTSLDVSGFKTDNVTNMSNMFSDCYVLTSLDVSGFKTDNVTDMGWMFSDCSGLTSLDVSGFKTDNVTNMFGMFEYCRSLTSLDVSGFNTSNVTTMRSMFEDCSGLTSLDLSNFKTVNVTNMSSMFEGCSGLTNLDLSGFNTANVTDMERMFIACFRLESIYVGDGWSTEKVESSNNMFEHCSNLIGGKGTIYDGSNTNSTYARVDGGADAPGYFSVPGQAYPRPYAILTEDGKTVTFYYDAQKTVRGGIDIKGSSYASATTAVFDASFADYRPISTDSWFNGCTSLTTIMGMENLKTDNVTSMNYMFDGCSSLTSLDVSGFKTDNVTSLQGMFYNCSNMTTLDVSSFNTDNVTDMSWMFYCCENLITIYASERWKMTKVTNSENMFYYCIKIDGGAGTTLDWDHIDGKYARIDKGSRKPGYFTYKMTEYEITYMVDGEQYKTSKLWPGDAIVPEQEPVKETYLFSGWSEIPETMPAHDITVTGTFVRHFDVGHLVKLLNFIMNGNATDGDMELLDVNEDGELNIGDVILVVSNILDYGGNVQYAARGRASASLDLTRYTAMQFVLKTAKNVSIQDIRLVSSMEQSHQLSCRKIDDETYAVVIYSLSNQLMKPDNGNVIFVDTGGATTEAMTIQNITAAKPTGETANFQGLQVVTGIQQVENGESPAAVYDLNGRRLNGNKEMRNRIIIINGNKTIVR